MKKLLLIVSFSLVTQLFGSETDNKKDEPITLEQIGLIHGSISPEETIEASLIITAEYPTTLVIKGNLFETPPFGINPRPLHTHYSNFCVTVKCDKNKNAWLPSLYPFDITSIEVTTTPPYDNNEKPISQTLNFKKKKHKVCEPYIDQKQTATIGYLPHAASISLLITKPKYKQTQPQEVLTV